MASAEPMTIRADRETVSELDALAAATDRSRNWLVNQALRQYLDANAWQVERIREGVDAAREGRLEPAEAVFARIGARHGWRGA